MKLPTGCTEGNLFDIYDACVQSFWTAFVPAFLIIIFSLVSLVPSLLLTRSFHDTILARFRPEEAEAHATPENDDTDDDTRPTRLILQWRLPFLIFVTLLQALAWITLGIYHSVGDEDNSGIAVFSALTGITWLYVALRPVLCRKPSAYVHLFILYATHLVIGVVRTVVLVSRLQTTRSAALEGIWMSFNLAMVGTGFAITSRMPLKFPSSAALQELYVKRSPEDYASIFEWATYSWVYPLVERGNTFEMKPEDVWSLTPSMQSRPIFTKFSTIKQPTLFRRLVVANSSDFLLDIALTTLTVILSYAAPCFLYRILKLVENPTLEGRSEVYVLALIAFVCALLKGQAETQHLYFDTRASARINVQLMNTICDKVLKRSCSGMTKELGFEAGPEASSSNSNPPKPDTDCGKIVNLMAVDVNKVSAAVSSAYILYGGALEITLTCVTMHGLLGSAAFAGFLVMFVVWILHIYITRAHTRLQRGLSASRDRRMSVVHELVNVNRFIKFFSWEDHWIEQVKYARGEEMDWMKRSRMNSVLSAIAGIVAPLLVSSVSFFVYIKQGEQLTPSVAFTTIVLMDMLRQSLILFADFTLPVFECYVSLERIEAFLNEERFNCVYSPNKHCVATDTPDDGLAIEVGHFTWNTTSHLESDVPSQLDGKSMLKQTNNFELQDINVRFPEGKLSLVTGPTGCGKTVLMLALLGEMTAIEGKPITPKGISQMDRSRHSGAISYAAQIPWIQYGTIRENILFGYPYDRQRYEDVLTRCALGPDLDSLENGDQTLVGDRGSNLSAGQEARIALARAVYAQTKYVLLDDPFSAVDAQTSRYLYDRLFCSPLLEGRTVILVTHHITLFLSTASYIVHILDGRISTQGYVRDLQASGRLPFVRHRLLQEDQDAEVYQGMSRQRDETQTPHESAFSRQIAFSTYKTYFQTASSWMWGAFVLLIVLSQSVGVVEKLWIREWGRAHGSNGLTGDLVWYGLSKKTSFLDPVSNTYQRILAFIPDGSGHPLFYVMVYAAIGFIMVLCRVAASVTLYITTSKVSVSLFDRLLERVVRADLPLPPRSQILSSFSKDMHAIDANPDCLNMVGNAFLNAIVAVITVMASCPAFVFPAIIIAFCYQFVATRYLNIHRQLLRMESAFRVPIVCALEELLDGIVTIRAFQAERRFVDAFHEKLDVANKMYYNASLTNIWLLFHHDVLGALAVFVTTLLVLCQHVGPGTAGLCISTTMLFTTSMYVVCRFGASVEFELNAVERVAEYLDIPKDHSAIVEYKRPPAYWPSNTNTSFLSVEGLSVRYGPSLPLVLNNVSFTLKGCERIGIIGRTGSGRSTLISSLLRLLNPADGRIVIDGIDIATISVHDLRSRITYIPEDTGLFSGTLRDNIDPFCQHEEKDCFDALRHVQLLSDDGQVQDSSSGSWQADCGASSRTTITLDTQVAPGGANFSLGERRLIAMARALLRRNSSIVVYEATNSFDPDTDAKIQEILRERFKHVLLITVASRLSTIIDYDRLIVLKDGRVVEFDTPLNLINREGGVFHEMCRSSQLHAELEVALLAKMIRDR